MQQQNLQFNFHQDNFLPSERRAVATEINRMSIVSANILQPLMNPNF